MANLRFMQAFLLVSALLLLPLAIVLVMFGADVEGDLSITRSELPGTHLLRSVRGFGQPCDLLVLGDDSAVTERVLAEVRALGVPQPAALVLATAVRRAGACCWSRTTPSTRASARARAPSSAVVWTSPGRP